MPHVQYKLQTLGPCSILLCCNKMLNFLTCNTMPCRLCWHRLSSTVSPLAGLTTWAPSQASCSTTPACMQVYRSLHRSSSLPLPDTLLSAVLTSCYLVSRGYQVHELGAEAV